MQHRYVFGILRIVLHAERGELTVRVLRRGTDVPERARRIETLQALRMEPRWLASTGQS